MLGNAPASPAPKRKRNTINVPSPPITQDPICKPTAPVSAVNTDHQITIRNNVPRGPQISPSQPVGISKTAYAIANAVNAHFKSATPLSDNSAAKVGAAAPKQARSR